jgi:HPt (histidine-containing phosphotransfer) domain-containing protein
MRLSLFRTYLLAQAVAMATVLIVPHPSWAQASAQVLGGWLGVAAVLVGIRRHRPQGAAAFYLFGAAVFLNAGGILVERLNQTFWGISGLPSLADPFYLGIYPGLIGGLALIIRRRRVGRDWNSLIDTTIIMLGLGLLSWVFLIQPHTSNTDLSQLGRIVLISYPVGDIVVLAMMVRLLMGQGQGSTAFRYLVGAVCALLAADLFWALVLHSGFEPGPRLTSLVYVTSQTAYALVGASVLHPSVRDIATAGERDARLHPLMLAGLAAAALIAPAVLLLQTVRGQRIDGVAIALTSTALFLLVLARMSDLVRRVEESRRQVNERNRAVRLVLDTVNEGLLRVSADGTLAEERSAMIDRWFGPFAGGTPLVDYLGRVDSDFATWFRLGLEAWRDGVLPPELCLEQLPRHLRAGAREFTVSYLPVGEGGADGEGLLLVIDDVTEQMHLAQQEAEQRELLAVFQGFARDRLALLAFFEQGEQQLAQLAAPATDPALQRRLLHTLKGNAAMVGLTVVAQLCHTAEVEVEAAGADLASGPAMLLLRKRWLTVTGALRELVGERGREVVQLDRRELDRLCDDLGPGLPPEVVVDRVRALRCEPVERALQRLANHARTLSQRLGKGDVLVAIEADDLRLDPERWAPFWADMVHLINNAVDHGLEPPPEREAAGKWTRPRLRLAVQLQPHELIIEVEDDGRGIDWDAIKRAATSLALPTDTSSDLMAALLSPGVSSRAEVTLTSGRGVGMSAVQARVRERGGALSVTSSPAQGTCWHLSFPLTTLQRHEGTDALRAQRAQRDHDQAVA